MNLYEPFMCFCAILCIVSAFCVGHHIVWMYKESKPTFKDVLFHWGVLVLPEVILSIYFFYNFLKV
jgi:hypothetical protein